MKIVLAASLLFLACADVWAVIGSPVSVQPDPNGNTGPFPPHMTQQWGSAPSLPPMPAGSTIFVLPTYSGQELVVRTGGNLPPTPLPYPVVPNP